MNDFHNIINYLDLIGLTKLFKTVYHKERVVMKYLPNMHVLYTNFILIK